MKDQKEKIEVDYEDKSTPFLIEEVTEDSFQKQFYFLYKARVRALTDRILSNARKSLGSHITVSGLTEVSQDGNDYFVVGVILKRMKYRRSVLYEFTEDALDFEFRDKIASDNLVAPDDYLELEDYQQIVKLGGVLAEKFVTGMVVGIFGYQEKVDLFHVKEVIMPELASQIPWPLIEDDCYVLFISGISLSSNAVKNEKVLFAMEKLCKWLAGEIYMTENDAGIVSKIAHMIIAGENIRITEEDFDQRKIDFLGPEHDPDKDAISHFDDILSMLVSSVTVDIMPGSNDPTSGMLPQQPIPKIVFPKAKRFGKFCNSVTNPYMCSVNGFALLGTAGQNVRDMSHLTNGFKPLDLMEECLKIGHMFPTVPDSIDGFPLENRDPLVIEELPHVFFAGNQAKLSCRFMMNPDKSKTLLLTIPTFSQKQIVGLLNLRNMNLAAYDFSQENDLFG
ncbi:DNA polymerase alpha/epsilon subunit B domain-containing protein [Ditylenchus destructor]|nr:DNA polymerase alpha/epsilon subunit B domain-containing protein [Ditylenchus destructor]